HDEMPPAGEGPKRLIIERLHFNDEQVKQYEIFIDGHRKKTDELHDSSREMHDRLFSLLKNDPVDKAKADSIIQQISDNQKAIDNLNFDHFQKIKSICKGDQVKDFNELAGELAELFAPKGPPRQ
ncbi:MAG: Spy/CpxP family protein refolding chaperone, partial [Bacteroidia bacterium]